MDTTKNDIKTKNLYIERAAIAIATLLSQSLQIAIAIALICCRNTPGKKMFVASNKNKILDTTNKQLLDTKKNVIKKKNIYIQSAAIAIATLLSQSLQIAIAIALICCRNTTSVQHLS